MSEKERDTYTLYIYIYIYIHTHTHIYIYIYIYIYIHTHTHTHYIYIYMCVHMSIHSYTFVCGRSVRMNSQNTIEIRYAFLPLLLISGTVCWSFMLILLFQSTKNQDKERKDFFLGHIIVLANLTAKILNFIKNHETLRYCCTENLNHRDLFFVCMLL